MEAAQLSTPTTTSNSVYGNGKTSSLCSSVLHVEGDQRKNRTPACISTFSRHFTCQQIDLVMV